MAIGDQYRKSDGTPYIHRGGRAAPKPSAVVIQKLTSVAVPRKDIAMPTPPPAVLRIAAPTTGPKRLLTLRVDPDVLAWFKEREKYHPEINAVLRAYMEAQLK